MSQINERHEYKHPRNSTNSKLDELEETHAETQCNQTFEKQRQRQNLESNKREVTHHIQGILNKIKRVFIRNFGGQKAVGQYIQTAKRKKTTTTKKQSTKNPLTGKMVLQK